ncbi:hypothetical protein B0T16DRAFT_400001 [Cercophora newfieldiana]|uniref:Uncharacterized protein n=1 Tax=Cercophora newfieldiana TaxID=92897 RepID=A0AA39YRE5_9PEZI|nr:hypothetical protein B0T16DRAFT_400001 [Cercophora newfieldiana]
MVYVWDALLTLSAREGERVMLQTGGYVGAAVAVPLYYMIHLGERWRGIMVIRLGIPFMHVGFLLGLLIAYIFGSS